MTQVYGRGRLRAGVMARLAAPMLALAVACGTATAQTDPTVSVTDWSKQVWTSALAGNTDEFLATLTRAPEIFPEESGVQVRDSAELLRTNLEKREQARAEQVEKLSKEIDEKLAGDPTNAKISDALRSAVELSMLATDKATLLAEPRISGLIQRAEQAARDAEAAGQWLIANEIFYRLNLLLEEQRTYERDVHRQTARLSMIRLYAPERFWQLRNDRRVEEGLSPLPPYNPTADDYHDKTAGITQKLVFRSLNNAADRYVERDTVGMKELIVGGIEGVRTLVELPDVRTVFPGLADDAKRAEFLAYLMRQAEVVKDFGGRLSVEDLDRVLTQVVAVNRNTVGLDEAVMLHEFGNGAMARLDPYSAIIWPDELKTFQRQTQGRFVGVGIQIQLDEQQNIKITTPLDGTPAQRAGVRAGDLIKKVDGVSTAGFALDQAVTLITGEPGKTVVLTVERKVGEEVRTVDIPIVRASIDVKTVKGWERTGPGEQDWDYFIDRDHKIGYVRLTQFTDTTTKDFDAAVQSMRAQGLNGLILDLRYNPGGLLDQAVSIASRFVSKGLIVRTETAGEVMVEQQVAQPSRIRLNNIPVVVLINEGSASASEIVSGAIQDYAKRGELDALLVGKRSFGKGSVQNVWGLTENAAMKLTTQYYRLPGGRLIDKNRHLVSDWGVTPDLVVDRLPSQEADAYEIRQAADVAEMDEQGNFLVNKDVRPDPSRLITEGLDVQLQTALAILQSRTTVTRLVGTGGVPVQPN